MEVEPNLGFVTVVEANGHVGGFLITNSWGRPLEFRMTTPVQPNRMQQILYGATLKPYLYADLLGKTLIDRVGTPFHLLLTDCEPLLDLRLKTATPVAWLAGDEPLAQSLEQAGAGVCRTPGGPVLCHPRFTADAPAIRAVLERLDPAADLREPFSRIREALCEARKLNAAPRAA